MEVHRSAVNNSVVTAVTVEVHPQVVLDRSMLPMFVAPTLYNACTLQG